MKQHESIVFVSAARTPIGAYLGSLKTTSAQALGVTALEGAMQRAGISRDQIDQVIAGNVINPQTANNIAKVIALDAGLPYGTTAMTVNRVCGSGLQAAVSGMHELWHQPDQFIAVGGVESMSRAPFQLPESVRYQPLRHGDYTLIDVNLEGLRSLSGTDSNIPHMGNTAENIARKYHISREEADAFAVQSQEKTARAMQSGRLGEEIVPVTVSGPKGQVTCIVEDEHPRPDTTLEGLARLRPAFEGDGVVTAGNASGINDGAAFLLMTTEAMARAHRLPVLGRLVDYQVVGCDPAMMGLGPVDAIQQLLDRHELNLQQDIDLLEINEAFAVQVLGCLKELGISTDSSFYHERFNPNGGAIALGHPLGMSGARLLTTLLYEFQHRPDSRYAIASACIGGGQGIAVLLENHHFLT